MKTYLTEKLDVGYNTTNSDRAPLKVPLLAHDFKRCAPESCIAFRDIRHKNLAMSMLPKAVRTFWLRYLTLEWEEVEHFPDTLEGLPRLFKKLFQKHGSEYLTVFVKHINNAFGTAS